MFMLSRLGDNSVHVHDCSPFWAGIFIIFKEKTTMLTVNPYVDMHILTGKTLMHFFML